MSIIVASGDAISRNILNKSVSKQMYSFPKTRRFLNKTNEGSASFYYNVPSMLNTRGTSLGYGHKSDFTKARDYNPPFYKIERLFEDKNQTGAPHYTFGVSREHFKKVVVNNAMSSPEIIGPGPGDYVTTKPFGSEAPKYTMEKKYPLVGPSKIPGPGDYTHVKLNPQGKYPLSKIRNSTMVGWSLSKDTRFKNYRTSTPGPNAYNPEVFMNGNGNIYNSRYKSCLGRTFLGKYEGYRYTYLDDPGPGAYGAFSEFGIYRSRNADDFDSKIRSKSTIRGGGRKNKIRKSASALDVNHSEI